MKYFYTDLINELVQDPAEKLKVFDKNSPYLPTRKIGKNNPKAEEIRIDNYLRQEWNNMVDRAVVEGVSEEELRLTKKKRSQIRRQNPSEGQGGNRRFSGRSCKRRLESCEVLSSISKNSGMQNMTRMDNQYFAVT